MNFKNTNKKKKSTKFQTDTERKRSTYKDSDVIQANES